MATPFEIAVKHARGVVHAKNGEMFTFKPRKKNGPNGGWDPDAERAETSFKASFYQTPEDVRPEGTRSSGFATRMPHVGAELSIFYSVDDCPDAKGGDHLVRDKDSAVYKILKISPDDVGGADMILASAKP